MKFDLKPNVQITTYFLEKCRFQVGFLIGIPLHEFACNCAKFRATVLELHSIVRNYTELHGNSRARNCAQVKSTCVRNPIALG